MGQMRKLRVKRCLISKQNVKSISLSTLGATQQHKYILK